MPHVEQIINELQQLNNRFREIQMEDEEKLLEIISEKLKFTKAMKQMLFDEVKRAKLKGYEPLKVLKAFRSTSINSKVEGKRTFEQIIGELKQGNV